MKTCNKCGNILKDDQMFCNKCGEKWGDIESIKKADKNEIDQEKVGSTSNGLIFTYNGLSVDLQEILDRNVNSYGQFEKIKAIKELRDLTNLGLADAKNVIEEAMSGQIYTPATTAYNKKNQKKEAAEQKKAEREAVAKARQEATQEKHIKMQEDSARKFSARKAKQEEKRKMAELQQGDSILQKETPGTKRNKAKNVITIIYLVFAAIIVIAITASTPSFPASAKDISIERASNFWGSFICLMLPALLIIIKPVRKYVPLFKKGKFVFTVLGWFILIVIGLTVTSIIGSTHSDEFNVAKENYNAQLLLHKEAEEQAKAEEEAKAEAETTAQAQTEADDGAQAEAVSQGDAENATDSLSFNEIEDSKLLEDFIFACNQIGIDVNSVKSFEQKDDWIGGPRYSFAYKGISLLLYCNTDSTVNSINIGDLKIYMQGYSPLSVNDYIPDSNIVSSLEVSAQDYVKNKLNYPSTAKFPMFGWGASRYGNIYAISNTVQAKNAFGVEDELNFYLEFSVADSTYVLKYFVLDGSQVVGDHSAIEEPERTEIASSTDETSVTQSAEIVLVDGQLGSYGKKVTVDSYDYIWYYIPAGTYEVTSNVNWCKVYLDKNDMTKNSDGYSESINVITLDFPGGGSTQTLTVGADEHIELTINAKITLKQS